MVNFFNPLWLLGVLVAPIFLWLQFQQQQQGPIAPHLQSRRQRTRSRTRYLGIVAWVLVMVAMAGPHWREQDRPHAELDRARVVVMDMSAAMYAKDIAPSRFRQAFFKVTDLIKQLDSGYTGLVAYTGAGYTISPLTHDTHTVLTQIEHLSPDVMPTAGKNAAAGVEEALLLLGQAQFNRGDILLVTSGISEAEKQDIDALISGTPYALSTFAISTPEGATVPDENGNSRLGSDGRPILSRLIPERLDELAANSGGIAITYQYTQNDVAQLQSFLTQMRTIDELTEQSESLSSQFINDGYWLLWPLAGIVLFLFRRGLIWSFGLVLLLPPLPIEASEISQLWRNADRQGYHLYRQGNYSKAAGVFVDPVWQGVAFYDAGDYQNALVAFSKVSDGRGNYNLANTLAKLGRLEEAALKYRAVLASTPGHKGAEVNLILVEEALAKQKRQEQESGEGESNNQQESGDPEGNEAQSENDGEAQNGQEGNIASDPDSENVPEQQGESKHSGEEGTPSSKRGGEQQLSDESRGDPQPTQQQYGESGEYEADEFKQGHSEADFGTPTADDLEAIKHRLSELGEASPVFNRLAQIKNDRTLLLKNLLLLQAEHKQPVEQKNIEW